MNLHSVYFLIIFFPCLIQGQNKITLPLNNEVSEHLEYKSKRSDVLHGVYEFRFNNVTQLKGRYVNGKKHGEWQTFHKNWNVKLTAYYKNDSLTGEFHYYNSEKRIVTQGKFKSGKYAKSWKSLYGTGENRRKITFDENGFIKRVVDFYPSGDIAVNTEISIVEGDTVIETSQYYANTNIARFSRKVNGELNGRQILYHSNGVTREELIYKNGLLREVGEARAASGKPLEANGISNGFGSLEKYHEYGSLYAQMQYKNGLLHDSIKKFQSGKLRLYGAYNMGKPVGRRVLLNDNFKERYVYDFKGDTVFFQKRLYNNFENKEVGVVVNGKKQGITKTYDGLGNLVRSVTYENGLKHGEYYENQPGTQSLRIRGQFKNGVRTGKWVYFNLLGQVTYRELYENNPVLEQDLYEVPQGYTAYVPQGFGERVNETFTTDIPVHNNVAYFLPLKFCLNFDLPGFDFFSQEGDFDFELRNVETGFSPDFDPPHFPGDEEQYIFEHMFPSTIELPASGAVLLRYKVDILGQASEVEVIRSIHEELDTAAVRLIESYPVLFPARFNGIPTSVYVIKSISY